MNTYTKSSETHTYEGSIHVDDLLNLYEKIRTIVILKFPDFKKAEPRFDISIGDEDSKDLSAQEVEKSLSPDQMLSSCSFTLNLPDSGNLQDVTSIFFAGNNRHSIHITAEGTNQQPVDELVSLIIYKINPYVFTMNKERQPPAMHEERKEYTITEKPAKPDVSLDIYEVPEIKTNLSDADRERLEKASRKNLKYILAAIIFIALIVAIVILMTVLK